MKKILFSSLFLLVGALAVVAAGSRSASQQSAETRVKVGDQVPAFTVAMFGGEKIDIADLRGKVVLINFWATWCPPCRAEFKRVPEEIVKQFQGQDFVFLPISREESYEKIRDFRLSTGYDFAMGMDPKREIYDLFAASTIPRNFLIDKQGKIVLAEEGYSPELFDEMIEKIKAELKK